MKKLLEVLGGEELKHFEASLSSAMAPTREALQRVKDTRAFLADGSFFSPEAEERWRRATAEERRRVLSELIWRAGCVVAQSETAVLGQHRFTLGYGFVVQQEERDGREVFVLL